MLHRHCSLARSQSLTPPLTSPLARSFPPGLKATDQIPSSCWCQTRPVQGSAARSQSLIEPSSLHVASSWPAGCIASERTHMLCPCKVLTHCPLLSSHTFTSPS